MDFKTVLIVHGDSSEREQLRDFVAFEGKGIQVREVSTEDEAERIIREQNFDVVLSSIILNRFKDLAAAGANIIILVPDESEEQLMRLTEHGLKNYQVFPTARMDLQDKLSAVTRDGVKRNHPRYDVPGTRIEFHHNGESLAGQVLNISEGGFLCEIVVEAEKDGAYRDDLVTIRFPRKYGRQVLSKIRCNYLATRKSSREGNRLRQVIVMLLPRLEPHHYEALLTTLQRVFTSRLPLLRFAGGQLEINFMGHRSRHSLLQVLRFLLILLVFCGLVVGASHYFKIPKALWISEAQRMAELELRQRELQAELALKQRELQAAIQQKRIVFTDKIRFAPGQVEISPTSFLLLDDIVTLIQANPGIRLISIEGHSDSDGDEAYNRQLSARRAEAVRNYLIGKGVAADMLQARGLGESRPLADNASAEGKMRNRRVEFIIREQR